MRDSSARDDGKPSYLIVEGAYLVPGLLLSDIRKIQRYVRALALEQRVPVVPSCGLDATLSRVKELVVSAATDAPHQDLRPAPPLPCTRTHPELAA